MVIPVCSLPNDGRELGAVDLRNPVAQPRPARRPAEQSEVVVQQQQPTARLAQRSSECLCFCDRRRPGTVVKGCGVIFSPVYKFFITCLYVINDWFEYKF